MNNNKFSVLYSDENLYSDEENNNEINDTTKLHSWRINNNNSLNRNSKTVLCRSVVNGEKCKYGNKCTYAHNLKEQKIDNFKLLGYNILFSNDSLEHIDLTKNMQLYNSLTHLTKLCDKCDKGVCNGGYNCKYGACSKKYHICSNDLNYGNCNKNCDCIHLTQRKLKPFIGNNNSLKNIDDYNTKSSYNKGTILTEDFFKKLEEEQNKLTDNDKDDNISIISYDTDSQCENCLENNDTTIDEYNISIFSDFYTNAINIS